LPNQIICGQTLSKFARFPESGEQCANMATLRGTATKHRLFCTTVLNEVNRYCCLYVGDVTIGVTEKEIRNKNESAHFSFIFSTQQGQILPN